MYRDFILYYRLAFNDLEIGSDRFDSLQFWVSKVFLQVLGAHKGDHFTLCQIHP